MSSCRYEDCSYQGRVDDEGRCSECIRRLAEIRRRIANGELPPPRPLREFARVARTEAHGGMPCDGCRDPILGEHFSIVYSDPRQDARGMMHLHDVCHEIWQQEASVD
jgi:hypothetical protein